MNLKTSTLLIFILLFNYSFAQKSNTAPQGVDRCGTMEVYEQEMQDPRIQQARQQIEQRTKSFIQQGGLDESNRSVVTIPVVVHVVYENSAENISATQIQSQLDVLNEDFRKLNSDTSNTRPQFQGDASDPEIQFCMAQRDPNGNSTNGITRTSTTVSGFTVSSNDVKYDSQGGKDAWPASDYLNIWVCELSGGTLGYAQFPGGNAATDGVVINYTNFGTTGTAQAPFNLGRTGTHEVGHWLNLYHTFQDGCAGTSSSTCNTGGDRVCDTPPVSSPNYGCPTNDPNTCTETPTDRVDQYENYMDYVDDDCMNMFTQGQKTRMQALFSSGGARESLLNSDGCTPLTSYDAGIASVLAPSSSLCTNTFTPKIVLKNFGGNTLSSVDIEYDVDGSNTQTYSWSGSLASGSTDTITLPSMSSTPGSHTFNATTLPSTLNGSNSDQNLSNDAASNSFSIVNGGTSVTLTIDADCYGSEVSWELSNTDLGTIVDSIPGGTYPGADGSAYAGGSSHSYSYCLPDDCFQFKIWDEYGDGMYGSQWGNCNINGNYYLIDDATGDTLMQMTAPDADYGNGDSHNFCITSSGVFIDTVYTTDVTCNGDNDGSILVDASGASDMDYSIDNGSSYSGDSLFTNLGGGTYDVIAMDPATGDADTTQVTITEPSAVSIDNVNSTDPTCGNTDGSISISASGGTGSLMYSIDGGSVFQANNTFTNLGTGTYNIVVTDTNGCQATTSTSLSNSSGPTISNISTTDPTCGNSDGSITISASGGTGTLQYSIDGGSSFQSNNTFANLNGGTYNIVVEDGNGCQVTSTATLSNSSGPSIDNIATTDPSCGNSNGSIDITASGGVGTLKYSIDGGSSFQGSSSFSSLSDGSYSVVVEDGNGCQATSSVTLTAQGSPSISSVNTTDESCDNSDGSISISASGGTSPLEYSIDGGMSFQTSSSFNGLSQGSYIVAVEDANGCQVTSSTVTITNLNGPTIDSVSVTDSDCGMANGGLTIHSSGGNGPLSYSSDGGSSFQSNNTFNGVPSGNYNLAVQDTNGCQATQTATVDTTVTPVAVAGADKDTVYVNNGGTVNFTSTGSVGSSYNWDFGDSGGSGAPNPSHSYSSPATYDVILTMTEGNCTATDTVTVVVLLADNINKTGEGKDQVTLFPNPTDQNVTVQVSFETTQEKVELDLLSIRGKQVRSTSSANLSSKEFNLDLQGLPDGIYFLRVKSDDTVSTKRLEKIGQ